MNIQNSVVTLMWHSAKSPFKLEQNLNVFRKRIRGASEVFKTIYSFPDLIKPQTMKASARHFYTKESLVFFSSVVSMLHANSHDAPLYCQLR